MNYFVLGSAFAAGVLVCSYLDTQYLELQKIKVVPYKTLERIRYDAMDAFGAASVQVGDSAAKLQRLVQQYGENATNRFLDFFGQEPDIRKKLTKLRENARELQEYGTENVKTVFTYVYEKVQNALKGLVTFLGLDT